MNKKVSPALIGAFIVATFFLIALSIALLGGGKFFNKRDTVIAYFEGSLQGLSVGSPVKYHGVTVGEVKEIRINIQASGYDITIPVLIDLISGGSVHIIGVETDESYSDEFLRVMVDRGLRATLKMQSLVTGKLYIELAFRPDEPPVFRDKTGNCIEIPTTASELQQISDAIQTLDIKNLVDKALTIFSSLERMSTTLDKLLNSPEATDKIESIFTSLEEFQLLLITFNKLTPPLVTQLQTTLAQYSLLAMDTREFVNRLDGQVNPLATELSSAFGKVEAAAVATEDLMYDLQKLESNNAPLIEELNRSIKDIGDAARSIRILADHLYRDPNMLIFGNSTPAEK